MKSPTHTCKSTSKNINCQNFAFPKSHNDKVVGESQLYRNISIYAILCIAFLICVFNPYALYATDITQFDSTQTIPTLCALFGIFLAISFIAIYLTSFIPKQFAKIPAFIFSLALFIGLIYSFILVGDYGVMDRFYFDKNPFVYDSTELLVRQSKEFIFVVALGIIVIAIALKRLIFVWKIVFLTLFIVSSVDAYNIIAQRTSAKEMANQFFSYSKSDKNIVVIMLDMFNGSHTPYILEQFPYFKAQLDGFTLFSNAISSANLTIPTIATLIGGEYYTAYNMNKRKVNLANSIDKAFIDTSNAFASSGFSVNIMSPVGSDTQSVQSQVHNSVSIVDYNTNQFVDFYAKSEGFFDDIIKMRDFATTFDIAQLLVYGVFKFAPEFSLRQVIYDNGQWRLDAKDRGKSRAATSINYTSNFYAFTRTIDTKSTKPTFKFFYSLMTHSPFGIYFNNNKCDFFSDKTAWEDYPHKATLRYIGDFQEKSYYKHFDGESCAIKYLADFVQVLKNAGIYDNTQIFVISDHGGLDSINIPILDSRPDVLFLFKDFGARGALKIDNRLMANYDIASIFCANLKNGCPNVGQNILKNYPTNREIIHTAVYHWILYKHRPNEWIISKAYKVKGNIYDKNSWIDISDKVANMGVDI